MLKRIKTKSGVKAGSGFFVIIASEYNAKYVNGMLRAARTLLAATPGVRVEVVRVPGAFEIPAVAARLAAGMGRDLSGLVCLGVILRGETTHAQFIGESVTAALAQIQVSWQVPVVHEVLLFENEEQAKVRCLSREHNRGAEAAATALTMGRIMRKVDKLVDDATFGSAKDWFRSLQRPTGPVNKLDDVPF